MPLLKQLLRAPLQSVPRGAWKILITDDHSHSLLETVYSLDDILQQNVRSVEPLYSPRAPADVDAIYLLTPTAQNVDRIIADFQGRRTYRSAHLFFVDGIDDRLAEKLTANLQGVLAAFIELYCNFWALEDRVFSTKSPWSFFTMFGAHGGGVSGDLASEMFEDDVKVTGKTLLSFLATINENPYIRYYTPTHHSPLGPLAAVQPPTLSAPSTNQHQPTSLRWRSAMNQGGGGGGLGHGPTPGRPSDQPWHLCRKLAAQLQVDLDEYMSNNPEFPASSDRPRGVMFIVDRSMDPTAPLLHEFWYQAMVNDLLPIQDGIRYRYTYTNTVGGKEEREALLTDKDPVWMSVKHLHMKDAIDTLMTDFGKFAQEHAGFRGGAEQVNVNDLKDMLASLPQFQEQREQFSLHLDMAQECMSLFEKKKLPSVAAVEQTCATGYTSEGKTPKTLVEEMVPLLADRAIHSMDKVRIIALYILFRDGVHDEDRRRLYQHARLSITEQDMINNLVHLGAKVIKDQKDRARGGRLKQKFVPSEGEYELSRFKPAIQVMLEDYANHKLDNSMFPFIKDFPPEASQSLRGGGAGHAPPPPQSNSLRSARPQWHRGPSARLNNTEGKQRIVIFVAGGVTYSEIRQAYVLGQVIGKDIFIGSTHVITPEGFLKDMRSLGRGGIGGHPPNAPVPHPDAPGRPARSPGQPMSYQNILNTRHWAPWVGPPPLGPPPSAVGGPPGPGSRHTIPAGPGGGQGSLNSAMSDLTLTNSKDSRKSLGASGGKKGDGDDKKKRSLFKLKWDKEKK